VGWEERGGGEMNKSIWGETWTKLRPYVYPAWLTYELGLRSLKYTKSVHEFLEDNHEIISQHIGRFGNQLINLVSTGATFITTQAFLTIPAGLLLYHFFKKDNITNTRTEERLKRFL